MHMQQAMVRCALVIGRSSADHNWSLTNIPDETYFNMKLGYDLPDQELRQLLGIQRLGETSACV
ncbi:hypothetical protein BABINDRAFT_162557 [Babjeviella inositovora NRRL Y-12698]|uniref:Uncharacterized protein n=1 Tax=Babjeviella inositovora NRRL Y-12698 TaxID=984486 RepID=A0A1E3QMJ0_9ASCO|nr:uncharacterized protein BABINDRAFT_162557 [Babjeviella inositovora NRRL Y-12698]ODQ78891.1 hypothetical protein BABINDRAFT_162557 [Babjeviella inositovora NRRL Y-12698]